MQVNGIISQRAGTHCMFIRSRLCTAWNWSSGSISTLIEPSSMEISCTGTARSTLREVVPIITLRCDSGPGGLPCMLWC